MAVFSTAVGARIADEGMQKTDDSSHEQTGKLRH